MNVTERLHRVFVVDQQIRGLQSRLKAAERFLGDQQRQLTGVEASIASLESQLRQLQATTANNEGEAARVEAHVAELRERMNAAKTNKEYKALLAEVTTFKEKQAAFEGEALAQMETIERLRGQLEQLRGQRDERTKVRGVAETDRDQRAGEIREKLEELRARRDELVGEVPTDVRSVYEELVRVREEEAMAPIEVADRKRHEFHCGGCMMSLPVETMSALLSHGSLTRCVSCGCILFLEERTRETMSSGKR